MFQFNPKQQTPGRKKESPRKGDVAPDGAGGGLQLTLASAPPRSSADFQLGQ